MDKVAIYARVSTVDNQDYERQISDLKRTILNHGYKDNQIEVFAEKISGYKKSTERPELTNLLDSIDNFKCLYVSEVSRIGRNPKHTRDIVEELISKRIPIYIENIGQYTINPDGSRNSIMSIILQVLMEFSHQEAETMKTRMKSGKVQAVKNGKVSGNNQAFGYTADENKMLVVNPNEAIVVEQIFQLYKEGNGTRVIANTLNQMGVPTRLNVTHSDKIITWKNTNTEKTGDSILWAGATIRQIIKNTIYKGKRNFKGHIIDVTPIVTDELFDECNYLMNNKTHRNYLTSYEYLLKDMLYCGVCGKKYVGIYSPKKGGDKVYKCTSILKTGGFCGNLSTNISLIESIIYDQISNSETLLKYLDNPNDILKQINVDIKNLEQNLRNEKSQLESKDKELERLLDLFLSNSKYRKDMFERKEEELTKEIQGINDKIILINRELFSKNLTISKYNEKTASKEMIQNAMHNRPELRSIFKQFIDKIIINTLNKKYTLATIFIKVNGITLKNTLKIVINASGVRAVRFHSQKKYQYLTFQNISNDPVFNNNVLLNDKEEILNEIENQLKIGIDSNGILGKEFITIKKENYIYINADDV